MSRRRYIYVIGADQSDLVKVGVAVDPAGRLSTLQCGSPVRLRLLATLPGSGVQERELHRQFARYRKAGEWFDFYGQDAVRIVVKAWLALGAQDEESAEVIEIDDDNRVYLGTDEEGWKYYCDREALL